MNYLGLFVFLIQSKILSKVIDFGNNNSLILNISFDNLVLIIIIAILGCRCLSP